MAAGSAAAQSQADREDAQPFDDQATIAHLTERIADLLQRGSATGMRVLIDGLSRTRTALPPGSAEGPRLGAAEIYRKARQSVVVLGTLYKCSKCLQWHVSTAAGFFLSPSGLLATNYHVVDKPDCETMGAMTFDGRVFPVREVLAASREDDVAILRVEGSGFSPLPLADGAPVGSPVFVLSHPDNRFYSFSTGIVARYFYEEGKGVKTPRMAITAEYARGSSGAPVLDECGAVVGMVSTTSSIYYTQGQDGEQKDLQMVVKSCVPARSILRLLK